MKLSKKAKENRELRTTLKDFRITLKNVTAFNGLQKLGFEH